MCGNDNCDLRVLRVMSFSSSSHLTAVLSLHYYRLLFVHGKSRNSEVPLLEKCLFDKVSDYDKTFVFYNDKKMYVKYVVEFPAFIY